MCETNVYVEKNGSEELVMENAAIVKTENENIHCVGMLGEEMRILGKIKEIRFLDHKIIIKE